ncbi:uncharacterized protein LOC118344702 [Juglans regia]|uniref:Uncharacterized protein LOC118344702 n=1 Tax=Juglans regia TaxID=51240 RepID=A0A6P9E0Z5_JUGRE|nr:uncharacterized protein LOC118344702 [Juglans regia]
MRHTFKTRNKEVFGHVEVLVHDLEQRIELLDSLLQEEYLEAVEKDLLVSKIELESWKKREETMLAQKEKIKWLNEGDNNTCFFHSVLKRRQQNQVRKMTNTDGSSLDSPKAVHEGAFSYFQEFLSYRYEVELLELRPIIDNVIMDEENKNITKHLAVEEVRQALFYIPVQSSLGPNGFGSGFFRECWEILQHDMMDVITEFFVAKRLPRLYTASYVALISKHELHIYCRE